MKKVIKLLGYSLLFLVVVACAGIETNAKIKSIEDYIEIEKLNGLKMGKIQTTLYYNPQTKCIYTNDIVPIADQVFDAEKGICVGPYQKYIK